MFDGNTVAAAVVAAVLAFMLEWFPGVAEKWKVLNSAKKAYLVTFGILVISIGFQLGGCFVWGNSCPAEGWWQWVGSLLATLFLAGAANQGTYQLARRQNFGER